MRTGVFHAMGSLQSLVSFLRPPILAEMYEVDDGKSEEGFRFVCVYDMHQTEVRGEQPCTKFGDALHDGKSILQIAAA